MKCPKCGADTNVYDSRRTDKGTEVRRRRTCKCGYRFRTYEITEAMKAKYEMAMRFYKKYGEEEST